MTHPGADVDPAEAMLAELAGLDLTLARHVHACAMTTEDPSEVADLARAYQRIARSLRQSLALHARLKRDRERGERETPSTPKPPPVPARDPARIAERQAQLRAATRRIVWSEYETEPEEAFADFAFLEARLEVLARDDTFGLVIQGEAWAPQPLDNHVADFCRDLRLRHAAWRDLPDPPPADDPVSDRPLESSA
jgi:hypothetical protein